MSNLLCFVGGLMLGGFIATAFLCCLQIARTQDYSVEAAEK